jgi:RHS repeat-associated protein
VTTHIYNDRLQPCWIFATTGTALAWQPTQTTCSSTASPAGNIIDLKYSYNSGSDNGNVMGITNNRDTTRSQSFTYDQVNRVLSAQTSSTSGSNCWGEAYTIDEFANLTGIVALSGYSGCTQESLFVSANTNNQLHSTGFTYDASGNMLTDSSNTYGYNAESEIKTAAGVTYTYDGDGDRVQKSSGTLYWYGAGTEILDESNASGSITDEYVYFVGARIAHRDVNNNIYYYAEDLLGTTRTLVEAGQTSLCYDADFYPFGGERDVTTACTQNFKFESKERDTETGNDDFGARYYTSRLGRWLSADWSSVPEPVPYANLTNPQTLNLYAMASDNPATFADLDGHELCGEACQGASAGGGGGWSGDESTDNYDSFEATLAAHNWTPISHALSGAYTEAQGTNPQPPNTQQAKTTQPGKPAQSGINPNYHLPSLDTTIKIASDFSAGAGDVLSLGATYLARKYIFDSDSVVNKMSGAYISGAVTGAAIGTAIGGTVAAVADGKNGALFGRGGTAFFNRGPVRFGWSWEGSAQAGRDVIRLGLGTARGASWWSHIPFYYP